MGLHHEDAAVRAGCCVVLDHFLDEAALPELIENLRHDDENVRKWAMHALACDRCKEGECRPGQDDVVPIAIKMLSRDSSRRVRAEAAHLLGRVPLPNPDVIAALENARDRDPHPNVRKIAARYAPGGAIARRANGDLRSLPSAGARRPYPRKRRAPAYQVSA
jgi:HEAT repeat protein